MNKEFIPYEHALDLIELGFNEPCLGWYQEQTLILDINANQSIKFHKHLGRFKDCFIAPTFSQTFRWFRENHQYSHMISKTYGGKYIPYVNGNEVNLDDNGDNIDGFQWMNDKYEEAELQCLKKLIKIVKI